MRILYLAFDDLSVPYAWTVHVRSIVNRLVSRGHVLRVVAPGGRAPGFDAPCEPLPAGALQHVAGSMATFVRLGREFRADLVYLRGIGGTVTPALAADRLRRPLVVELNGILENELASSWRRALVRQTHRFTLARTARVVTVAPLLREEISRRYGYPAGRIDVVRNGADTALFRPRDRDEARRRLGLPLDRTIVLCVASFYPHHAREVLERAAAQAQALLVLVGGEVRSAAGIMGVGPVPHERVPDFVAAADVCAFTFRAPDRRLGCSPVKVYEYMAAGRPVAVATDMEEVSAFVRDNGIGVSTGLDAAAFAGALAALASDGPGRERMGRRGRELAESTYNWDRAAAQVERSLEAALRP